MAINHENEEAQVENTEPSISENDTNDSHSSTQSSEEFLANFDWVSYQEAAETVDEKVQGIRKACTRKFCRHPAHRCNPRYSYTHD